MISIILPSVGRPEQLRKSIVQIASTAAPTHFEIIAVVDDDEESKNVAESLLVRVVTRQRLGPISAWNDGASHAWGNAFVAASDDFDWHEHWLTEALKTLDTLPDSEGMVGFNDMHHDGNVLATNFLVTRKYAALAWGGVIYCPHYKGFFCDNEAIRRAQRDRRYVWSANAVTEHLHWSTGKAVKDAVYSVRDQWWGQDSALFDKRSAAGYPNDYPPSFGL